MDMLKVSLSDYAKKVHCSLAPEELIHQIKRIGGYEGHFVQKCLNIN